MTAVSKKRVGFRGAVDTCGSRFVCVHCYRHLPLGRDDQQETYISDVLHENGIDPTTGARRELVEDDCPEDCACLCHTDVEDPGPEHLPECRWSDPNFGDGPFGEQLWDGVYDSDGEEILRDVGGATGGCVFCGVLPEDVKPGPLPTWPAQEASSKGGAR